MCLMLCAQARRDPDSDQQKATVLQDHIGVRAEERGVLQEAGLHGF